MCSAALIELVLNAADRTHTLQVGADATAYDVKEQIAALQGELLFCTRTVLPILLNRSEFQN